MKNSNIKTPNAELSVISKTIDNSGKKYHEINNNILINPVGNSPGLSLELEVQVDGKTICNRKAHSYVANFLVLLFLQMRQYPGFRNSITKGMEFPRYWYMHRGRESDSSLYSTYVTNATNTSPIQLSLENQLFGNGHSISVHGVLGNTAANGLAVLQNETSLGGGAYRYDLYEWPGGSVPKVGNGPYTTGGQAQSLRTERLSIRSNNYSQVEIVLGRSTNPVVINDYILGGEVFHGNNNIIGHGGELTRQGHIRSEPAVSATESYIQITRDFVNNSGVTVTTQEVGLHCYGPYTSETAIGPRWRMLIARDLQTIVIPSGSTATVNYRIKTEVGVNGGILQNFLEMLYRHMASTSREAKDIDNQNRVITAQSETFACTEGGGYGFNAPGGSSITTLAQPAHRIGPVIGRGTANVDITDFNLATEILHGSDINEMRFYGTYIDDLVIDTGSNIASFKIYRVFENNSGAPITINECGLNVYGQRQASLSHVHQIFRNLVSPGVVVNNGDLLKLVYTVSLVVV